MPKANATIAGREAAEIRTSGGWCAPLRATETITVIIPRATPGTWYQMDACLRAPGLPQQQAQISSMLRSVRIAKGGYAPSGTSPGRSGPSGAVRLT
jgi:hypothetical protein